MYTVAIAHKDQPPTTRIAADASDLHSLVRVAFYTNGRMPATTDAAVIARLIGDATALADDSGVADLDLGDGTTVTVHTLAAT